MEKLIDSIKLEKSTVTIQSLKLKKKGLDCFFFKTLNYRVKSSDASSTILSRRTGSHTQNTRLKERTSWLKLANSE